MKEGLALHYVGKDLRNGMDAEDLASAIEGFASMVRVAGNALYGETPRIDFRVKTVQQGSLDISFLLEVAGAAQTFMIALPAGISSATPLLGILRQWFDILLHLRGKPPTSVQKVKNSPGVQIQNTSGETKIFQQNVYNSFNFHDIGRHSEKIARPLKRRASGVEVKVRGKVATSISKKDIGSFRSVRKVDATLENVSEVFLKIVSPVFEGSSAWKFSRDRNVITATVEDARFLASVQSGLESFRAGDILKVRLRSTQEKVGRKIRDYHTLEEVISHERPTDATQDQLA